MGFLDKLNHAAKTAGSKAGVAIEIAKLRAKARAEESEIARLKHELGQLVWEQYGRGETLAPDLADLCERIKDSLTAIDILSSAIETLKTGSTSPDEEEEDEEPAEPTRLCGQCGAPMPPDSRFCGACGSQQEEP